MESVWGTVLNCDTESHRKGAPMKMPTLRTTSRNQSCCPVCRRAFSERSRWLAVFWYGFAACLRTQKLSLRTRFTRRLCLCVSKNQSGSFSRFPKAEPLVVEREFQGGENRNSPLWRIFAYFLFVKKVRARPGLRGKPAQAESTCGGTR